MVDVPASVSLMYLTAHGRALPCCIAPFPARGYENYTLGDATQQTLREIWNGDAYRNSAPACLATCRPSPARVAGYAGACEDASRQRCSRCHHHPGPERRSSI